MFKGTYRHRIDGKGRLPVPAPFRRQLAREDAEGFVVTLLDECLAVYPTSQWTRLETQLQALPAFSRPVKALVRLLASRANDARLDVQGRILLPASLRAEVGLERDALVIGVLDRFEVWPPDAWDGFVRESERFLDDASLGVAWPLPGRSGSAPRDPSSTRQP